PYYHRVTSVCFPFLIFSLLLRRSPSSPLFPYTTLFRSCLSYRYTIHLKSKNSYIVADGERGLYLKTPRVSLQPFDKAATRNLGFLKRAKRYANKTLPLPHTAHTSPGLFFQDKVSSNCKEEK